MAEFRCPSFVLPLPEGVEELSTYGFVLPEKGDCRPNVVVKWQTVRPGVRVADYVEEQTRRMQQQLKDFTVDEPAQSEERPERVRLVFSWGSGRRRFSQIQTYQRCQGRIYTLTGTGLARDFARHRPALEQILAGFAPQELKGGGRV